jgi:hypothetical protein
MKGSLCALTPSCQSLRNQPNDSESKKKGNDRASPSKGSEWQLPPDLNRLIAENLSDADQVSLAASSREFAQVHAKSWFDVGYLPDMDRYQVRIDGYNLSVLSTKIRREPGLVNRITGLCVVDVAHYQEDLLTILSQLLNLELLDLKNNRKLTDAIGPSVCRLAKLRDLNLSNCKALIGRGWWSDVDSKHTSLPITRLTLKDCSNWSNFTCLFQLRHVKYLNLCHTWIVGDHIFESILTTTPLFPNLVTLDLSFNYVLHDSVLDVFAHATKLEDVDLQECTLLEGDFRNHDHFDWPNLRKLNLQGCIDLMPDILTCMLKSTKLKLLIVTNTCDEVIGSDLLRDAQTHWPDIKIVK